jgi:hypothetical protein
VSLPESVSRRILVGAAYIHPRGSSCTSSQLHRRLGCYRRLPEHLSLQLSDPCPRTGLAQDFLVPSYWWRVLVYFVVVKVVVGAAVVGW